LKKLKSISFNIMSSSITKNEPSLETTGCPKSSVEGAISKPVKRKGSKDASPKRNKKKAKICARVKIFKDSVDSTECDTILEASVTSVEKITDVVKVGRSTRQDAGAYSASENNAVCFDSE